MEYSQILKDLRRESGSVKNRIQSIIFDSKYVAQFSDFPLVANERCGLWYIEPHNVAASVYFKSTDGHTGQWKFSMRRLNFHLLDLFAKNPVVIVVDSTRKGKLMPDALSKTIPMWCAVLNYIMFGENEDEKGGKNEKDGNVGSTDLENEAANPKILELQKNNWLVTPRNMVSESEHSTMVKLVPQHAREVLKLGLISRIEIVRRLGAKQPLLPHWIYPGKKSQNITKSDEFFPICCLTASYNTSSGINVPGWHFSHPYVQGAADDHELWASSDVCEGKLDHSLLWKDIYYEPSEDMRVVDMATGDICSWLGEDEFLSRIGRIYEKSKSDRETVPLDVSSLKDTGIFVGAITQNLSFKEVVKISDSIQHLIVLSSTHSLVDIPENPTVKVHSYDIESSKKGSKKLRENLPDIVGGICTVNSKSKVVILCDSGKDLSIAVALSILCRHFDTHWLSTPNPPHVNKDIIKQHLCMISNYRQVNPSRNTLQAVNTYLM